jgi:microcystin-dependent protein
MKRLLATAALASALQVICLGPALAQGQYLSEVRLFASNFCPVNWLPADGRLLPIRQYTPLFSLLGITYGGDGTMNFGLPDLVGRAPYGSSPAEPVGTPYGNSTVTAGNQQPNNRGSALAMTWCIAYQGMFPERPRN